ncbi:bile acid:sodium symporter family protein [Planctomicrobium piriforme]|uniref:Bile acid:Na+ symporter, BASS family n=1 Tax=Planctomicrobium piriforme TaxID=1576369 RepID=A0A1I3C9B8_9PLAN|nr:bile acid:sodium symporter [Planctomicrobium piriforme]SFH71102.1 bile acid:Na+ symporter, BASS family [Planctomicrobium piriforme]
MLPVNAQTDQADLSKNPGDPDRLKVRTGWNGHAFQLLVWLLGTYAIAVIWPQPGLLLKAVHLPGITGGAPITIPHLLLGTLLFCAGLTVETVSMPQIGLRTLPWHVLATWLIPLFVVGAMTNVGRAIGIPGGILLGLMVAAAMPVANSSVGWSHLAGGNLPLSLGLLLGGTVTAPILAPVVLRLLSTWGVPADLHAETVLSLTELAEFLGVWVVAPALLGLLVGLWSRRKGMVWSSHWLRLVSISCLLLLNYLNASEALPLIRGQQIVLQGVLCTLIVNSGSMLIAWVGGRRFGLNRPDSISLSLAVSMRNTGAALVLAGSQFQHDPAVTMTILLHTLLQHVVAGALIPIIHRRGTPEAADGLKR